jgi:hypothetical protein
MTEVDVFHSTTQNGILSAELRKVVLVQTVCVCTVFFIRQYDSNAVSRGMHLQNMRKVINNVVEMPENTFFLADMLI